MLEKLIVFVEEYSMEAALELLLPNLLRGIEFQVIRFQCKDDLLKKVDESPNLKPRQHIQVIDVIQILYRLVHTEWNDLGWKGKD